MVHGDGSWWCFNFSVFGKMQWWQSVNAVLNTCSFATVHQKWDFLPGAVFFVFSKWANAAMCVVQFEVGGH